MFLVRIDYVSVKMPALLKCLCAKLAVKSTNLCVHAKYVSLDVVFSFNGDMADRAAVRRSLEILVTVVQVIQSFRADNPLSFPSIVDRI